MSRQIEKLSILSVSKETFSQDTFTQYVSLMGLYSLCVLVMGKAKERDKRGAVNQALGPGQ